MAPKFAKDWYHLLRFMKESLYFKIFHGITVFYKRKVSGFHGQFGQDYLLNEVIFKKYNYSFLEGVLVEVGANDPVRNSNSLFFSKTNQIISIDPLDYSSEYNTHRINTTFVQCAISDFKGIAEFYKVESRGGWEDQMSGFSKPESCLAYEVIEVKVDTLNNILAQHGISKVNVLILDAEGSELKIIRNFNFSKYQPDFCVIENKMLNNELRKEMKMNGYYFTHRFWTADDVYVSKKIIGDANGK
jgi:FkbM family methyltransferase